MCAAGPGFNPQTGPEGSRLRIQIPCLVLPTPSWSTLIAVRITSHKHWCRRNTKYKYKSTLMNVIKSPLGRSHPNKRLRRRKLSLKILGGGKILDIAALHDQHNCMIGSKSMLCYLCNTYVPLLPASYSCNSNVKYTANFVKSLKFGLANVFAFYTTSLYWPHVK